MRLISCLRGISYTSELASQAIKRAKPMSGPSEEEMPKTLSAWFTLLPTNWKTILKEIQYGIVTTQTILNVEQLLWRHSSERPTNSEMRGKGVFRKIIFLSIRLRANSDHIDDRFYYEIWGHDWRLHDANGNACYWLAFHPLLWESLLQSATKIQKCKDFFAIKQKDQRSFMGPCLLVIRFLLSRLWWKTSFECLVSSDIYFKAILGGIEWKLGWRYVFQPIPWSRSYLSSFFNDWSYGEFGARLFLTLKEPCHSRNKWFLAWLVD